MNPISPLSSACLMADSDTLLPLFTRSSNGLFASSDPDSFISSGGIDCLLSQRRFLNQKPPFSFLPAKANEHAHHDPWKVRLMTSSCCSRDKRTKFTA